MNHPTSRCDLHLHSSASVSSGAWFSELCGCPESYIEPEVQYDRCRERGMTLVTLTDHDSIEGGLKLLGRPGFFLSEEITTQFPENGCVMHVLAWNISPAQHKEIQKRRANIYELSAYLRCAGIHHGLAHPLLSPTWNLDADTLERCLVLFPALEAINGMTDRRLASDMTHLLSSATPRVLTRLAAKHQLSLGGSTPGRLVYTAGSDDHVGRHSGTTYTEVDGRRQVPAFFRAVMAGEGRVYGAGAHINVMATTIDHTAYNFMRQSTGGRRGRSPLTDMFDVLAGHERPPTSNESPLAAGVINAVRAAAQRTASLPGPSFDVLGNPGPNVVQSDALLTDKMVDVSDALIASALQQLLSASLKLDIYGVLEALPELVSGLMAVAPLLYAADDFGRQCENVRRLWPDWTASPAPAPREHLAVFSDSLDNVDGVAIWCARFGAQAQRENRPVWFARCAPATDASSAADAATDSADTLRCVARFRLPFYETMEMTVPSLGDTIERMWRKGITHVELATPGPMGFIGLLAARVLHVPVTATYHTDVLNLVDVLGGPKLSVDVVTSYLRWFYHHVDRVSALSAASRDKLVSLGVAEGAIRLLPVAIDPDDFTPSKRSSTIFEQLRVDTGHRPVVLSVGRLSEEKNVRLMIDAVGRLQSTPNPPILVVVGDGPQRQSLQQIAGIERFVAFVGAQHGERLRQIFASADVFVFASRSDTLGLVNFEALASGIPVVVPADAAIASLLSSNDCALFYDSDATDLAKTLAALLRDPARATNLGRAGRQHSLDRWQDARFRAVWRTIVDRDNHTDDLPAQTVETVKTAERPSYIRAIA